MKKWVLVLCEQLADGRGDSFAFPRSAIRGVHMRVYTENARDPRGTEAIIDS